MDHPRTLSISSMGYELPAERIAQQPLAERDAAKLLRYQEGIIADHHFRDLADLLPPSTLLVLNDTRVVHARIRFKRATGAVLECMVLTPAEGRSIELALEDQGTSCWWCMMGNAKRWKGEELVLDQGGEALRARRIDQQYGEHLIEFTWKGDEAFVTQLDRFGAVPLPPYMRREAVAEDDARYNTVFGDRDGSVAAPTASLHFTSDLLQRIKARGIGMAQLTLHVGAGTFLPVKSATMAGHAMHSEQVRIPFTALEAIKEQLGRGPIVPVGTTALRTLESVYWHGVMLLEGRAQEDVQVDQWEPYDRAAADLPDTRTALDAVIEGLRSTGAGALMGSTRLLIAPGYTFRFADGLITNFHQPKSTLLLLVAAFLGLDWRKVYDHALRSDYRFLSYGDGSLLWRSSKV